MGLSGVVWFCLVVWWGGAGERGGGGRGGGGGGEKSSRLHVKGVPAGEREASHIYPSKAEFRSTVESWPSS